MKNNKSIYIVGVLLLLTIVSVGYALLSGTLNINGNTKINAATWDIYFSNIVVNSNSVEATIQPTLSSKTAVNFEVELKKPGDFYEFNVDVVNNGIIDAMVESISITPELTANQQKYLNYSVTYADGVAIEKKDILHAEKARTLKVRVEYNSDISSSDLVNEDQTINVNFNLEYVQADETAKESTSLEGEIPPFKLTKITGNGTNVGDEVAIGSEHFYVVSNDGTNAVLLSKYKLDVLPTYDASVTYKQRTDNTGSGAPFSSSLYWENTGYVYEERASISKYVNNYQSYLESFGASITEARLITREELRQLGCVSNYNDFSTGVPEWVYSTTYWTGSADSNNTLFVIENKYYDGEHYGQVGSHYPGENLGIRPVIVVPSSSI